MADRQDGWRAMTADDLPEVTRIADIVHADLPESPAVLAERLALFPAGCLVTGGGYAIAHPARFGAPPPLDTLLGALPPGADALHLHDIALLPGFQGRGLGGSAVRTLAALAATQRLRQMTLIAVHGTPPYWARLGFVAALAQPPGLASYGPGALYMARALPPA